MQKKKNKTEKPTFIYHFSMFLVHFRSFIDTHFQITTPSNAEIQRQFFLKMEKQKLCGSASLRLKRSKNHSQLYRISSFTSSTCILCPHLIQHPDYSLIEDVRADDL